MFAAVLSLIAVPSSLSVSELHANYGAIFSTGNRNAASHLWASWVLSKSAQSTVEELTVAFSGFCPVSGSPVNPSEYNAYHYTLKSLVPGTATLSGLMHHCCAPCVCDTHDMIWSDTASVRLADGSAPLNVAVIGDPCRHASALQRPFNDPFSGEATSLGATAPEVQCDAQGKLITKTSRLFRSFTTVTSLDNNKLQNMDDIGVCRRCSFLLFFAPTYV